ncbi:hypothetical protein Sjap_020505 [Stephania japonica]|uniref:Cytochrome P450 n=1 Tax=Stephania japonica TaxID=461633 RepID=A0AAP0F0T9_9MAGN
MITTAAYMCDRLISAASDAWAWWAEAHNEKDKWAQAILTVSSLALLIIWYIWTTLHSKSRKPHNLRYPPGPRGLPLVGHLPFLDPQLHTYFANLATTYGPIYKLKLGNKLGVVVTSPSLAREILRDNDVTFANHDVPLVARVVAYGGSDVVWTPYGPEWRMLRRVCVRDMLNNASLDAVYALRKREVKRMVKAIHCRIGSPTNLGEELFLTILNVITNMLWGGSCGGGGGDERLASLGAEFRVVVGEITELLGKPNLSDFFPSLARFDLQGLERDMKVLFLRFDRIFDTMIEQRLKSMEGGSVGQECKDFLHTLLQLKNEGQGKVPFTMEHLKALFMDMVVGGTDTTANTLEWAMAELMNKPETMSKAQEELDIVVGKDCEVEEFHLPKLQYLQAVVKEALRLRPGVPLLVPHCPSSSCNIGGYLIPKGARVFLNVWAMHRDPSIWDNPLEFNPERFMNSTCDYNGNYFNYLPFGSGRRICAGIPMAEKMLMYGLATLLHLFDWELPKDSKLELKEKFGIVMKKATPLIVVPKPRLSQANLYS